MEKYNGFDVDSKKTLACVIQKGEKDVFFFGLTSLCYIIG